MRRLVKRLYLIFRAIIFSFFSLFTFPMRRKGFSEKSISNILIVGLNRIGDNIVSIPTFKAIKENLPQAKINVLANSLVKDILDEVSSIDKVVTYGKDTSFLQKIKLVNRLRENHFDLAIDLTCDYSFVGALWTYLSKAKYRLGYNIFGRGFLFNRPIKHSKQPIDVVDEILNIIKGISLGTEDKKPKILPSKEAEGAIEQFLQKKGVSDNHLLIGIHPGGYYPSQRWLPERFVEVADRIIEKYKAKIILIAGAKEERLIKEIEDKIVNKVIIFLGQPLKNLIALISRCNLLIGNNSGPLHIATALGISTVSVMGPTDPVRWWPKGDKNIVIRKDLPCSPCNRGICKEHKCMKLITVEEVTEAVEVQIATGLRPSQ